MHIYWYHLLSLLLCCIFEFFFLVYLSDVQDGEFQYIEGSHTWSGDNDHNEYTNDTIEEKYKDKIISFKKNAGGIIISNIYGIHRAKPTNDKNFVR